MKLNIKIDVKSIIIFSLIVFISVSYFNLTSTDTTTYLEPQIFLESQGQDSEATIIAPGAEPPEEAPTIPPTVPPAEEATEPVPESTEQTDSEPAPTSNQIPESFLQYYNNNPHIIRKAEWSYSDYLHHLQQATLSPNEFVALMYIKDGEINLSTGLLKLNIWQDRKATGTEPLKLTNGELRLFDISSSNLPPNWYLSCSNDRITKNCFIQNFAQASIDLSNRCVSGCNNILTRSSYYTSWNDMVDNNIIIDVSDKIEIFGFVNTSSGSRWNISSYTTTHVILEHVPSCAYGPGTCFSGQTMNLAWTDVDDMFVACSGFKVTGPNQGEENYHGGGYNGIYRTFLTAPYNGVEWSSYETAPTTYRHWKIIRDSDLQYQYKYGVGSHVTTPTVGYCSGYPKTQFQATNSITLEYYKTLI